MIMISSTSTTPTTSTRPGRRVIEMWGRAVIVLLGVWLLASPWIFRSATGEPVLRTQTLACGFLVVTLTLVSCLESLNLTIVPVGIVGAWLIGWAYFAISHPRPPYAENEILVGWLILMFVLVPRRAAAPPPPWREDQERSGPPRRDGDDRRGTRSGERRA